MPNRKESQDVGPPLRSGLSEPAKSRVRIGRACDRCKIKKGKCDGNTPCSTCVAAESICEYSVRRRREARDWYWGMQDVIDEALQRLYWACREGRGFPGVAPDERSGRVGTDAILRGLGLSPPPVDNAHHSGARSDSILDTQAQLFAPRSYHPPDVQPQPRGISRNLNLFSSLTPLSNNSDDRLTFGDGISETGGDGRRASMMDLDEDEDGLLGGMADGVVDADGLPPGLANSLPDGLGADLQVGFDAKIDPSIVQGGHVGYMGRPVHSNVGTMPFAGGMPLDPSHRHSAMQSMAHFAVPSLGQQRLESVTQSLGTVEQQVWQGHYDNKAGDALPWPGNMSSVQQGKKARGGRGRIEGGLAEPQ